VLHIDASDLSTYMGIPGQYTHEQMRAAFETSRPSIERRRVTARQWGSAAAAGFPELVIAARRALPDWRLRCRLHPQRRPRRREAVTRAEIVGSWYSSGRVYRAGRGSLSVLADYIGPHKIIWATDYPHSDGFFPGAPQMIGMRLEPLSPEARHQVMAGGAMAFYGLH
jgi:Amidohydrolase